MLSFTLSNSSNNFSSLNFFLISGLDTNDERRLIDVTMTQLRQLCEELNCAMFVVSHLKRPEGKFGHEEGVLRLHTGNLSTAGRLDGRRVLPQRHFACNRTTNGHKLRKRSQPHGHRCHGERSSM